MPYRADDFSGPWKQTMQPTCRLAALVLIFATFGFVSGSSMPIWELLSFEEKMGRVLFVLMQLVGDYCRTSQVLDCRKVMMLYGTSNLMNLNEKSVDALDVYDKTALENIWQTAFKSTFKYPNTANKPGSHTMTSILYGLDEFDEDVDRPPTPVKFVTAKPPNQERRRS